MPEGESLTDSIQLVERTEHVVFRLVNLKGCTNHDVVLFTPQWQHIKLYDGHVHDQSVCVPVLYFIFIMEDCITCIGTCIVDINKRLVS